MITSSRSYGVPVHRGQVAFGKHVMPADELQNRGKRLPSSRPRQRGRRDPNTAHHGQLGVDMGPIVSFVLIAAMSTGMQLRLYIRCQALVYSRQAPDSVAMPPDLRQRIIGLKHITVDRSIPRTRRMHAGTVADQDHDFGCGFDSPRMGLARAPTTSGVSLFSIGTSVAGAHYHELRGRAAQPGSAVSRSGR